MKLIVPSLILVFLLSSCNTTIGFARDLRQAGEGLEKAAQGQQGGGGGDEVGAPTY
jgi:predicted small secreted protein